MYLRSILKYESLSTRTLYGVYLVPIFNYFGYDSFNSHSLRSVSYRGWYMAADSYLSTRTHYGVYRVYPVAPAQ